MTAIQKVSRMTEEQHRTHQGGKAYAVSLKEQIAEFFSLGLLNGNYYQSQEDVLKNAKSLFERARAEMPEFATRAAIYGNNRNSLKLVPMIWLVYASTLDDKSLFRKAYSRIVRNPKMALDVLDIARKGGIRQGAGRVIKDVTNDWMINHLNDYLVSNAKGKLEEIIKVTRPKCKDEKFQRFMRYVSKGEVTFKRAEALKDVIAYLENGTYNDTVWSLIEANRLQLEELKHSTKKLPVADLKKLYEAIYGGLNYAATILNLVALERVYAIRTEKVRRQRIQNGRYVEFDQFQVLETDIPQSLLDVVVSRIEDLAAYRKSNMLPFALLNAEKMVVTPEFQTALANVLRKSAEESFNIDAEIDLLGGIDTSASMSNTRHSALNDSETLVVSDVANLFGAMLKKSHARTRIFAVAEKIKPVDLKKQDDVFKMARQIKSTDVGYSTYFEQLMDKYNGEKFVLLITDSEQADNLEKRWLNTKKPKGAKLIIWQLVSNGVRISKDPSVVYVCGYSDRLLGLIKGIIEDKGGMVEEIEKVEL